MGKYKQFKTFIRKKLGLIGVGEIVNDAVEGNTKSTWNNWFSNKKYLARYNTPDRIASFVEMLDLCKQNGVDFSNKSIIDIGCGTGYLLHELKRMVPSASIIGTDFSEESINISQDLNPDGQFFVMDVFDIPLNQYDQFDCIICSEVLEHLLHPEQALHNILFLLKENCGSIILSVPDGRIDNYGGHINFWSPESWKVFIENNIDATKYKTSFLKFNNNRNNLAIITKIIK